MIARKRRAPVLERADEAALVEQAAGVVLGHACEAEPGFGGLQHERDVVEREATLDTHIQLAAAVQEALDGKVVDWMEHVTDAEYLAGAAKD